MSQKEQPRWSITEWKNTRDGKKTRHCAICLQPNERGNRARAGGFSSQLRGLFESDLLLIEMNRPNITTPYNSIPGTDGRVIREDTFSNPQSSHVLRHSGTSEREERGWKRPMTLLAFKRTHTHTFIHEAFGTLGYGGEGELISWCTGECDQKQQKGVEEGVVLVLLLIQQSARRGARVKGQLVRRS